MLIGNDFKRLETSHADIGFFVEIYEMTPDQFIKEYEKEKERDLTGKVVVSVEQDQKKGVCINAIYFPKKNHKATLTYNGHISFIDIRNENDVRIELLAKDDECYPCSFNEWYHFATRAHCLDELDFWSKEYFMKLINTMIQGYAQDLSIEYKEEDIIVLEGL